MPPQTESRLVLLLRRSAIALVLLLGLAFVLALAGADAAIQVLGALVFGWFGYVARVAAGLHGFLRWLCRETGGSEARWKTRWTLSIVGVVVLMFAAGIATVGVAHQTAWLITGKRPLVEEHPSLYRDYDINSVESHLKQ